MGARKLSLSDRAEAAQRYRAGESTCRLAEAYGMTPGGIERALTAAGVTFRTRSEAAKLKRHSWRECQECGEPVAVITSVDLCPACAKKRCGKCRTPHPEGRRDPLCFDCRRQENWKHHPPVFCRICGRVRAKGTSRDLCSVHTRQFCARCEEPLPRGRARRCCSACATAEHQKQLAKPGRVCCICGKEPASPKSWTCVPCQKADYESRRKALMHIIRPCVQCGVDLPVGRYVTRCKTCLAARDKERRKERQAKGAHVCANCHRPLPLTRDTYCAGCVTVVTRWRKDWHQGDPAARAIGTIRKRRKWEQKEEAENG